MADLGRPLEFGLSAHPADPSGAAEIARLADEAGIDLLGIQDHPYNGRFLDTWTLMSFLAARTERVRLFPNVANLPLRPPAMLAKAAASLDLLTGGRVELGLGAGGFWEAIESMGGPHRSPGESVDALEEAIDVMRLVWSGEGRPSYDGTHYSLKELRAGPAPAHDIGIWLGALKPRMLRLTGRKANGWSVSLGYVAPDELAKSFPLVDEGAREAGRDPAGLRRLYNVSGDVTASQLAEWALEIGMDTFVFWGDLAESERFARETVPAVREEVERARG